MASYYRFIDGVRYARDILDAADFFTRENGEAGISLEEIQQIFDSARDGWRITDTEKRSLQYIARKYPLAREARSWLHEQIRSIRGELDEEIRLIMRAEFDLPNIRWEIDPEEVNRQEAEGGFRLIESAVRGALTAFLERSIGPLSFAATVANRTLPPGIRPTPRALLEFYLDQATLFLAPLDESRRRALEYDLPRDLNTDNSWVFGLYVPTFYPLQFLANVSRRQLGLLSTGYFSQRADLATLTSRITEDLVDLPGLEVRVDPKELKHQMALKAEQNFGAALFAALDAGIFNGESSLSFRDFIREEIWPDPDRSLKSYMREYLNNGILHLIPSDYRKQTEAGAAIFPIPENFNPWVEGEWIFGLEMPRKTNVHFLINTPRDDDDGAFGWNDGFVPEGLSVEENLRNVLNLEFELPGLQLIFSEAEFTAQRRRFGPQWRRPESLLRQALNTITDDYRSPASVFALTARMHRDRLRPQDFEDPLEYRQVIRELIYGYLKTATLELLPIELPDNNPADGEPIEEFWQFFALLPDFSDYRFWVIIPRRRREGMLPYVYGVT